MLREMYKVRRYEVLELIPEELLHLMAGKSRISLQKNVKG